MGKGQRVRAGRAAEKEAMKIANAKKAKKQKITKITTTIVAILLVVCLVGGLVYNAVYSAAFKKGTIQRDTIVLQTENYSVDAAMMSYFFYSQYNNFVNNYSSYLSSLGLDTSKSLKTQDCSFESGSSWFEYFANQAGAEVKEYLYLAEKAIEEKLALDEEDQKDIQAIIDDYGTYAKNNGMETAEFLTAVFGTGINESDVRKCLELSVLSQKYYDKYQDTLVYTDAEIEQFYKDNMASYRYVDYYNYTIKAQNTSDSSTYAAAEAKANALAAAATSTEAFSAWVENDFRNSKTITADYTKEKLEEELKTELAALAATQVTYTEDDETLKWLFNTAKVGDVKVFNDGSGSYTVVLCTATPYRDESATRTIRDIVLTTANHKENEIKATADKIMAEMKVAGLTEATFEQYASLYSENTATAGSAGLCENYKKSTFEGNIGTWVYDANRKAGDFEAVKIDDGYAICYYVGEGIPAWKSDCINDKKSKDYSAAYEEWTKVIELTENEKGYKKIPSNV